MGLSECIDGHTHREYRTWIAWLDKQWDKPSRHDWYIMQLTAELVRKFHKKPREVSTESQRIKFVQKKRVTATSEEATERSKSGWLGFLGIKRK